MKKIVIFVLSVVLMLLSGSCERMVPEGLSHADEQVLRDFRIRYPKAGIVEISNWDEGSTEIHFTDADGLDGVAIYLGETWMITEKTLYEDDFLSQYPEGSPERMSGPVSRMRITVVIIPISSKSHGTGLTKSNMSSIVSLRFPTAPKKSKISGILSS